MREMTEGELYYWYKLHEWPCCGGKEHIEGPHGGMSVNVSCPACGMKINVLDPESRWADAFPGFGQVIHAPDDYVPPPMPLGARVLLTLKRML